MQKFSVLGGSLSKSINPSKSFKVNSLRLRSTAVLEEKTANVQELCNTTTERKTVSFDDPQIAYRSKSTRELLRAYAVFKLCSISFLVDHQYKILKWTRRLMGKPLFRRLMAGTVYGQFMAGEQDEKVLACVEKHRQYNVQSMLNYTAMETHGFTIDSREDINEEDLWKQTIVEINNSVALAAKSLELNLGSGTGEKSEYATIAYKITNLTAETMVRNMNCIIDSNTKLVERTLNSKDETLLQCLAEIASNSKTLADRFGLPAHSNTSQASQWLSNLTNQAFHLCAMQSEDLFKLAKEKGHDLAQPLPKSQLDQLLTLFNWISESAQKAESRGVRMAVDAEQSYLQLTLDLLTLDLMRRHNTTRPVIFNTYQCYRTRTHDILVRDLQIAEDEGFGHGSKVVRGGYMDEERRLATEQGYPDPINPTYQATTDMYYRVAGELLEIVQADKTGKKVQVLFATHNEDTVKYIVDRMSENNMVPDSNTILFGQLMGMRDHISFSLGHAGIPAAKMLHYGPIDQGMAYLSRRVTENRVGIDTADKEREMVARELVRRMKNGQLIHKTV